MPEYFMDDTIAAIATPLGEGGLSVIRISGANTLEVAKKVFKSGNGKTPHSLKTHTVYFGRVDNEEGQMLDQVLLSFFKGPHSYTGEDVVEISMHGGMAVTNRILKYILSLNVRHAEPGEFTKRAFLNGKIDLTQAEAVLDLIKAKSEISLNTALDQLQGRLSKKFKNLKDTMMNLYAHVEAYLDFPEDDLEVYENPKMREKLNEITQHLSELIKGFERNRLLREGITVVLAGRPNVGKSSLFNALLERDRALVSELPGTTRDHLEEALEIEGVYVRLIDTAGLSLNAKDELDQMGMERTKAVLRRGQLFLFLMDGSNSLSSDDAEIFKTLPDTKLSLAIITKSDLNQQINQKELRKLIGNTDVVPVSSKTSDGIEMLEKKIIEKIFGGSVSNESEQITRIRHLRALEEARQSIERGKLAFDEKKPLECLALELKAGLDQLRELVGEVYNEDLLDVIFSEFCIGK